MTTEMTIDKTGTAVKAVASRPELKDRSEPPPVGDDLAAIVVTPEELKSSSAARDIHRWQTEPGYRQRRHRPAVVASKGRLEKEREKHRATKAHGDQTRERVAAMPKKISPRPQPHIGAEVGGILQIPDTYPPSTPAERRHPHYWSRVIRTMPDDTTMVAPDNPFPVGRKFQVTDPATNVPVDRDEILQVMDIVLGDAPDAHRVEVRKVV
jgi:hypothetical protein